MSSLLGVRQTAATTLPTKWGVFQMLGFECDRGRGETAVVLALGNLDSCAAPLLRIHSQCLTGDALGSLRCDCGDQLQLAMRTIAHEGYGLLIYEHQEGRGIGLMGKLRAYGLQDHGMDTIAANEALGFAPDCRDFLLPVEILHYLGIRRVRLLSNNPDKRRALTERGIEVVDRIPCETPPNAWALSYLQTKKERMGHLLTRV
jgi:GTP cyclohydrolase II